MHNESTAKVSPGSAGSTMSDFQVQDGGESVGSLSRSRLKIIACILGVLLVAALIVIIVLISVNSNKAESGPCLQGHCRGHGSCIITKRDGGDYNTTCVCDLGYTGKNCETVLDGWGEWGTWDQCYMTRSCGLDTRTRTRTCYKTDTTQAGSKCSGHPSDFTLCTYVECPECLDHKNVTSSKNQSLPYIVSGMTGTSTGDLAFAERFGNRCGIFTTDGSLIRNLTVPESSSLWGVARKAGILFFVNYGWTSILIIREDNTFIKSMHTGIEFMRDIVIREETIWVTAGSGLYKLTFNKDYNVTHSIKLVQVNTRRNPTFNLPTGLSLVQSHIVVASFNGHYVHYLALDGSSLFPPVGGWGTGGGQLKNPLDVATDGCGRVYVLDRKNNRIVLYSETGRFLQTLFTEQDGLVGKTFTILFRDNNIYVSTDTPERLYVLTLG